jgi:hypothetical protein
MKTITDAQIKSWKAKHGNIYEVTVELENEEESPNAKNQLEVVSGVFRKPDLDIISAGEAIADKDSIKKATFYFDNCWLGGDERMKSNSELKLAAALKVVALFKIPVATIKKL